MKPTLITLLAAALASALSMPASAARHYELALVDGSVDVTAITNAGDDRLFVADKEGLIWIYRNGVRLPSPYLDIRDRVRYAPNDPDSEQGLLGLDFHPNYSSNGYFFVTYTNNSGDSVVARYGVSGPDPDHSAVASERILMVLDQFGANHNVNHVLFGPDGLLYIGAGDGGYQPEPRCTGQQPDSLHGKILRVDVDQNQDSAPYYGIPGNNPFLASPVLDEVWAMGLRNPWRFSFDHVTGDFWMADVGHHRREELNFLPGGSPGGQNWGFKMMEGFTCLGNATNCVTPPPPCFSPAYTSPVLDYGHSGRRCAIIGGHVYRGSAIPALQGVYLTGDYCGATFLVHKQGNQFSFEDLSTDLERLIAFGEDADHETYMSVDGKLYKLVGLSGDGLVSFTAETFTKAEDGGSVVVTVKRAESTSGPASVNWATATGTAGNQDFVAASGTLNWAAGDGADKQISIALTDDAQLEGTETFQVVLSAAAGASLGSPSQASVQILDDELGDGPCVPSDTVLCLADNRFHIAATWRDYQSQTGVGHAIPFTFGLSGFLYFFDPTNIEVLIKTLDGCAINGHYWVYAAATTDVEYTLRVIDTETGKLLEYRNALGVASPTINDIVAFPCE